MTLDVRGRWDLDPASRQVLLAVLRHGPISRADLARRLGLSSPSLTRLAKPLLAQGLVVEGDPVGPATTGRPSLPLEVRADAGGFVGAKVTGTALHLVLVDLRGEVLQALTRHGVTGTRDQVLTAIGEWLTLLGQRGHRIDAVGIGLPATVDAEGQTSRSIFLDWSPEPLGEVAEQVLGVPCAVENDVNALTLAEHWFGFGREVGDFAMVTVGLGTGVGLVANDGLVRGHQGAAGLVGRLHTADGALLTDLVETVPLAAEASRVLGRQIDPDELGALRDEPSLQPVWTRMAGAVGELVAMISMLSAPEAVTLAGENADLLAGHLPALWEAWEQLATSGVVRPGLDIATLGFEEWARGAGAVAIRRLLVG